MAISEKLNNYLKENNLKQTSVSIAAGIEKRRFNDLVKGRRKITADDIISICNALKITPNELFGYEKKA